jgi:hypothetical protein
MLIAWPRVHSTPGQKRNTTRRGERYRGRMPRRPGWSGAGCCLAGRRRRRDLRCGPGHGPGLEQAARELSGGGPTSYVALRVDEGEGSSANRGRSLRMLIEDQHFLCRPPTPAEQEALEKGFEALGVQTALHR